MCKGRCDIVRLLPSIHICTLVGQEGGRGQEEESRGGRGAGQKEKKREGARERETHSVKKKSTTKSLCEREQGGEKQ